MERLAWKRGKGKIGVMEKRQVFSKRAKMMDWSEMGVKVNLIQALIPIESE